MKISMVNVVYSSNRILLARRSHIYSVCVFFTVL